MEQKIYRILQILGVGGTIWQNMDTDLLLAAFIHKSGKVDKDVSDRIYNKYGQINYETLEFVGDAVIHLIYTNILLEDNRNFSLSEVHHYRSQMERNLTFYCYMNQTGLCNEIIRDERQFFGWKECADIFEAIIGALYWYGYYELGLGYNVIPHIRDWLVNVWKIDQTLDNLVKNGSIDCQVDGGYGMWSEWRPCSRGCGGGVQVRSRKCDNPAPYNGGEPCSGPSLDIQTCNNFKCTNKYVKPTKIGNEWIGYDELSKKILRREITSYDIPKSYQKFEYHPNLIMNFHSRGGKSYLAYVRYENGHIYEPVDTRKFH